MDLTKEIYELFAGERPDPDDTGALVIVYEKLSELEPILLYVIDEHGHVLACHQCKYDTPWMWELCRPKAMVASLSDKQFAQISVSSVDKSGSHNLAFKVEAPDGAVGFLVAVLEEPPEGFTPTDEWRDELLKLATFAWISIYSWCEYKRTKTRVEHLTAEHEILVAAHQTLIAENLETEEKGRQERDEHLSVLQGDLQKKYQELELALRDAQAADRAKSDFLANMSHEIRTPMTAIMGFADLLLEEQRLERQPASHAETILRNGEHLLSILNDILDFSKIEAGKLEMEEVAFGPWSIVQETLDLFESRATEKGLALRVTNRGPIPCRIRSDPTRLRQILINLVNNAIKFTLVGNVEVSLSLERGESPNPLLAFEVADTGIGISEEQLGRLFQPFVQADTSSVRRFGGTGLGLAICKRLVQLLEGDIRVESKCNEGSRFRFRIPTGPLDGVELLAEPATSVSAQMAQKRDPVEMELHGKILLAEDGTDNQRLISFLLEKAGAEVWIADNGRIAIEMIKKAEELKEPFDLVVMDMQMPELDGYSATRVLRQMDFEGTIIALTAHAMRGDREKCLDAGCDDYATKPIKRRVLLETVARHLRQEQMA
ncbi:MAG: ATP-binding protein [Planctomycetota bacterium]